MADHTYNTDHSSFLLKSENKGAAAQAVIERFGLDSDFDLSRALDALDLDFSEDDDGNVIDVFLISSYFEDEIKETLTEILAPFVEDGSFVVFYGGGANGCWAISWEKNSEGVVTGFERDLTTVLDIDLKAILRALKGTPLGEMLEKKYAQGRFVSGI